MPKFGGFNFKRVPPEYSFTGDAVVVIKDVKTEKMFVASGIHVNNNSSIRNYRLDVLRMLGQPDAELIYYVFHRLTNDLPPVKIIAQNVRVALTMEGKLWSNQTVVHNGIVKNLNDVSYYIYALINEKDGAIYLDFDYAIKRFINPMNKKAMTFNGFVMRKEKHTNRAMHEYAVLNFPLKPEEWFATKIDQDIVGQSAVTNEVSRISVELQRKGFLILNRIYGVDPYYYRQNLAKMARVQLTDYIGIKREDSFDELEGRMR